MAIVAVDGIATAWCIRIPSTTLRLSPRAQFCPSVFTSPPTAPPSVLQSLISASTAATTSPLTPLTSLNLPLHHSLSTPSTPHDSHASFATHHPFTHLLIVEDNLVNQKVLQRMMQRLGYGMSEMTVVDNGQKGVDAVVERVVAGGGGGGLLVMMDVYMPVLNGLDATRAIRNHPLIPANKQPYIIALTANAMTGDESECLAAGLDGFLSKPVQRDTLRRAMEKAWKARAGDRQLVPTE